MKKLLLISCLLITFNTYAKFEKMIVFGDSLSDIGNFPESEELWDSLNADIFQNFYIPPTDTSYFRKETLRENWTTFLNKTLFNGRLEIFPRNGLNDLKTSSSVNYAWWSAVTHKGCFGDDYQIKEKECSQKIIDRKLANYKKNLHKNNHIKEKEIYVPGLKTQIELYKHDVINVKIDKKNAVYFIFIGGNGIYDALAHLGSHTVTGFFKFVSILLGSCVDDIISSVKSLDYFAQEKSKIIILNIYDLSLTPRLKYLTIDRLVAYFYSRLFNARLYISGATNKYKNNVYIFDTERFINDVAFSKYFKKSLGSQCDNQSIDSYLNHAYHCYDNTKNEGYLYWNNSHPSLAVHKLLAKEIFNSAVLGGDIEKYAILLS